MRHYKLYIAYIKNFEFIFKFELYYSYKPTSSSSQHSETSSKILRFLNTIHDDFLKTLYMIYRKLRIGYNELSTNLMNF
jgi:hypothetical protein